MHPRTPSTLTPALAGLTAVLIILSLAAPSAVAMERPLNWTCDESGLLVCAGAESGANVDCTEPESAGTEATVSCAWTYGQIMGGASPLGLPGEAAFSWSATIEQCITDAGLSPISCTSTQTSGEATCVWAPLMECIESQGPNPGETGDVVISQGECLLITITTSATAEAWTLSKEDDTASATHTGTGSNAEAACLQNNGR